ncbi:MAG: hypothetical protein WAW37_12970 [Syntrophobacteraceae bacterium]
MGAILGTIARALIGSLSVLFGTWKAFLGGFLVKVLLVVVLYNLVARILNEVLTWVVQKVGGINTPSALVSSFDAGSISSLGAWLLTTLRVPECFAFMLSVILLKWTLRKIPFVRW